MRPWEQTFLYHKRAGKVNSTNITLAINMLNANLVMCTVWCIFIFKLDMKNFSIAKVSHAVPEEHASHVDFYRIHIKNKRLCHANVIFGMPCI